VPVPFAAASQRIAVTSTRDTGLAGCIIQALEVHPKIDGVRLTGSRAKGKAGPLSDWDFEVATVDFPSVASALPALVAPLEPLAQQWDRLSERACYMLMLAGIGKVDLIIDEPWESSAPWEVTAQTLRGIDDHFWDWTIWLAAKDQSGKRRLVATELLEMHGHLLEPMGVTRVPESVAGAVTSYIEARARAERRLGSEVPRAFDDEVRGLLTANGYAV